MYEAGERLLDVRGDRTESPLLSLEGAAVVLLDHGLVLHPDLHPEVFLLAVASADLNEESITPSIAFSHKGG